MRILHRLISRLSPSLAARWSRWAYERETKRLFAHRPGIYMPSRRGPEAHRLCWEDDEGTHQSVFPSREDAESFIAVEGIAPHDIHDLEPHPGQRLSLALPVTKEKDT